MRVARAFNTEIEFPVIITTVPPSAQPSIEQVLSHQIYSALANYLASRVSAELASDEAADEETETGMGRVALDGSAASNFPGRFAYKKKKTMNTFIHNLPLSSLRWKALYFQLSRINKVDGNFLYWQISLSLVCPLRNHVTLPLSHLSLSACKDGGYRE